MRAKLPLFLGVLVGLLVALVAWFYQSSRAQNYAKGIIQEPTINLRSDNTRTNLVLLGIGGTGHEGGELTDSILIASINHTTKTTTLISVPRDTWLASQRSKINAIYYYGEQSQPGTGLQKTKDALTEVLGIPVHYAVLLDFTGFIKAIDAVGGIEVDVANAFDDYKYPIPGKENAEPESERYEHLHFDAGIQKMDGVTALKYVRSRHALGDEGTDFARSLRQQKVIRAFLASLISTKTVFNTERIATLQRALRDSVQTDIPEVAVSAFTKLALSLNFDATSSLTIESELYNPANLAPYGGAWVLLPKVSWEQVHSYVQAHL